MSKQMKFKEIICQDDIFDQGFNAYDNQKTNSSTAIIIRKILNPKQKPQSFNYEILFLQRGFQPGSAFSGQVCFPGGKRQQNQTSYDAIIRQVKEQTGLILTKQNFIKKNKNPYIVYQNKNKIHTITSFVFQIFSKDGKYPQVKLNQQQLSDYKWISLDFFLNLNEKVQSQTIYNKNKYFPFEKALPFEDQNQLKLFRQNYIGIVYPSLKIGMKSQVLGSTYMIVSAYINFIFHHLLEQGKINGQIKKKVERVLNHSHKFRVKLKDTCPNKQYYQQLASKVCEDSMRLFTGVWPKPSL